MRAILYTPPPRRFSPPKVEPTAPLSQANQGACRLPRRQAIALTVICDGMFLMVAIGTGLLFQVLIQTVWPSTAAAVQRQTVESMIFWAIASPWLGCIALDVGRALRRPQTLPFQQSHRRTRSLYWRRLELSFWTVAACAVLLCLCLLPTPPPMAANSLLAGVVTLIALVVRKRVQARRHSFAIATWVFCLTMLAIALVGWLVR